MYPVSLSINKAIYFIASHSSMASYVSLGVSLTLCCFVVYSTRRFVLCLALCYFVLVFFSPFSIEFTSLGEERASLSAFHAFVRFAPIWLFPLPLGVWNGLWFMIVALPGLFSYLSFSQRTVWPLDIFGPRIHWFFGGSDEPYQNGWVSWTTRLSCFLGSTCHIV